ncbi:MAG: rhodanese-like domain-containing protein [Ignavibacteriae bacterium]|nr:rhodanese-like domain-containing protein [Ignavibacteriota bacterium]
MAAVPVIVILFTSIAPSADEIIGNQVNAKLSNNNYNYNKITVDNLISELLNKNNQYNLIDLRSKEEYKKSHIPLAINIPFDQIKNYEWENYFTQKFKTNIFYSDNVEEAKRAYLFAEYLGDAKRALLTEPISTYFAEVNPQKSNAALNNDAVINWRVESHQELIEKEKFLSKFSAPVKKKVLKIKGGCS